MLFRSLVRLLDAVQRLHQRRLAGPVLADDGVDRAVPDQQVDVFVGDDAREPLGDALQFDSERRSRIRWCGMGLGFSAARNRELLIRAP